MSEGELMQEQGMCLQAPDANWSKLDEQLQAQRLASLFAGFKLVDFAWTDGQTLWLIEFKRYYDEANPRYQASQAGNSDRIDELFRKTLSAALLFNPQQKALAEVVFPLGAAAAKQLKIAHLLQVKPEEEPYLLAIKQEIARKLKAYHIQIEGLFVLSYDSQSRDLETALRKPPKP